MAASDLGRRLARGAIWSLVGALASRGLMLIAFVVVARLLGKEGFGEFAILRSTVETFGVFAGFGLGLTATKYVAEFRKADARRAGRILRLSGLVAWGSGTAMGAVLFFSAPWLAERTLAAPHLAGMLRIGCLILLLSAVNGAQTGALAGFEAFKAIARVNLLGGVASFFAIVAATCLAGLEGALWGTILGLFVTWGLARRALRRETAATGIILPWRGCLGEWPILWKFSLPSVLSGALVGPVQWVCSAVLLQQSGGYGELGAFAAVLRIEQIPQILLATALAPMLPVLTERYAAKATDSYNRAVRAAFAASLIVTVPFALIQAALPAITLWPFGNQFRGHEAVVQWLMLHAVLIGLTWPFGSVLTSMNRVWFGFGYNLAWAAVYLPLTWALTPAHRAAGLAAAFALAYLATSSICVAYICRNHREFIATTPAGRLGAVFLLLFGLCAAVRHFAPPLLAGAVGLAAAGASAALALRLVWPAAPAPADSSRA